MPPPGPTSPPATSPMARSKGEDLHGVVVVDKPAGPTSHDVVDRVRRATGVRRVGHTGTLDPFATGVLAVCVGKATRLARFLAGGVKEYRAVVRLGFATATDDSSGETLGAPQPVEVTEAVVQEACTRLVGELSQVPPAYSAKHVGGRRLHEMARAGIAVERSPAAVTVHALQLVGFAADRLTLDVRCSPGTYVRALARDLGEALGCGGHLEALRRTRTGPFGLDGSVRWEDLDPFPAESLAPMNSLLADMPAVRVGGDGLAALRHGRNLGREQVLSGFPAENPPERLRVMDAAGEELLALAVPQGFGASVPGVVVAPVLHPDVVLLA
jgi:tRNA pseudouridine55 synthase